MSAKAVQRVRSLHSRKVWDATRIDCPHDLGSDSHVESCFEEVTTCNGCGTDWPCSTIRAIEGSRR